MLKKILLMLLIGVFLLNFATALTWSMPVEAKLNENFNINIFGNGLYGIEIPLPEGFEIVSDISNGKLVDGTYRTTYASNLDILFRSTKEGTFNISGQYTEGDGVKSFESRAIRIIGEKELECPICEEESAWSGCVNNQMVKNTYICSSETNYVCELSTITADCEIEQVLIGEKISFFQRIKNFFSNIWGKIAFWK